jgi:aspartyl aminopeptidase
MYETTTAAMASFIQNSPTAFHAVANIKKVLKEKGFCELVEGRPWNIARGGTYFVSRNNSSIIAFAVGEKLDHYSFKVVASHSDSPSFKVKEHAEIEVSGKYTKLNTEGYGGMLCGTWFDRPLSIAGRAVVKEGDAYRTRLVDFERDLVLIPSLAIHMNRKANEGYAYNKQVDLLPLLGCGGQEPVDLKKMVAQELAVLEEQIYGMDLYLYNRMAPSIWGADGEFISCGRLDDLQCAWTSLQGFLEGADDGAVNVFACFDNEEVGSGTKQGACSTFLYDVLTRINGALGKSQEDYCCALASSFLLSCDNAHAVHPNQPDKSDVNNRVYLNEGIVVKSHAGQKYTSDGVSIAVFRGICEKAGVPIQFFANRSDMAGGSTLGNLAMAQVSMNSIDIGLPQLAMHSAYETAGVKDSYYMEQAVKAFFRSSIQEKDADTLTVQTNVTVDTGIETML